MSLAAHLFKHEGEVLRILTRLLGFALRGSHIFARLSCLLRGLRLGRRRRVGEGRSHRLALTAQTMSGSNSTQIFRFVRRSLSCTCLG